MRAANPVSRSRGSAGRLAKGALPLILILWVLSSGLTAALPVPAHENTKLRRQVGLGVDTGLSPLGSGPNTPPSTAPNGGNAQGFVFGGQGTMVMGNDYVMVNGTFEPNTHVCPNPMLYDNNLEVVRTDCGNNVTQVQLRWRPPFFYQSVAGFGVEVCVMTGFNVTTQRKCTQLFGTVSSYAYNMPTESRECAMYFTVAYGKYPCYLTQSMAVGRGCIGSACLTLCPGGPPALTLPAQAAAKCEPPTSSASIPIATGTGGGGGGEVFTDVTSVTPTDTGTPSATATVTGGEDAPTETAIGDTTGTATATPTESIATTAPIETVTPTVTGSDTGTISTEGPTSTAPGTGTPTETVVPTGTGGSENTTTSPGGNSIATETPGANATSTSDPVPTATNTTETTGATPTQTNSPGIVATDPLPTVDVPPLIASSNGAPATSSAVPTTTTTPVPIPSVVLPSVTNPFGTPNPTIGVDSQGNSQQTSAPTALSDGVSSTSIPIGVPVPSVGVNLGGVPQFSSALPDSVVPTTTFFDSPTINSPTVGVPQVLPDLPSLSAPTPTTDAFGPTVFGSPATGVLGDSNSILPNTAGGIPTMGGAPFAIPTTTIGDSVSFPTTVIGDSGSFPTAAIGGPAQSFPTATAGVLGDTNSINSGAFPTVASDPFPSSALSPLLPAITQDPNAWQASSTFAPIPTPNQDTFVGIQQGIPATTPSVISDQSSTAQSQSLFDATAQQQPIQDQFGGVQNPLPTLPNANPATVPDAQFPAAQQDTSGSLGGVGADTLSTGTGLGSGSVIPVASLPGSNPLASAPGSDAMSGAAAVPSQPSFDPNAQGGLSSGAPGADPMG